MNEQFSDALKQGDQTPVVLVDNEKQIIKVEVNEQQEPVVSARELHKVLEISKRFSAWWETQIGYGFTENEDYTGVLSGTVVNNGATIHIQDYAMKLDMAKELAMVSKTEKGKEVRKYFIQVEKDFNSPEKIMARALKMAEHQISVLKLENTEQKKQIEADKPKVIFANAVSVAHTSILIGDLAKLIKQNGVDIGQKRLFAWMRENGYLIKRQGADYNSPTQRAMDLCLLEVKETSITHADGHVSICKTTKVTGKGQQYFINKFLNENKQKKPILGTTKTGN